MFTTDNFQIRPINEADRDWITRLLQEWWAGPKIVTRGKIHHADRLPGFIVVYEDRPTGLITYNVNSQDCQIVTINSLVENIGINSALIEAVKKVAVSSGCKRLWLITTNDNMAALRFYQKKGFVLVALYPNAIEESRRLKPEIPLSGNNDIPIRDEIEFELIL
jgi:GNAT superfamily N-acetyltransferase